MIEQQVDEISSDERLVFTVAGDGYRSRLIQVKTSGSAAPEDVLLVTDAGARFVPSDPRDSIGTRYLPLQRGVYELRLRWPAGSDLSDVLVRPRTRDKRRLPAHLTLSRSDGWLLLTALFEVPEDDCLVRLHFVLANRPVDLPSDITLVQLMSETRIGERRAAARVVQDLVNPAAHNALRWLADMADEAGMAALLPSMTEANLHLALADDPWLLNYAKNAWEFLHARTVLTSYPTDICIPIADVCNARCTFCTSWLEGTRTVSVEEVEAFEPVFRFARWVGLAGHGEPLSHPRIRDILARLGEWLDRRAEGYVVTNGVYLPALLDELLQSRIRTFAVSLNAASAQGHVEVMGLPRGSFEQILDSVRRIVARRETHGSSASISMVITQQNVAEVPAFVDLGNELGVDKVQLKTLAPAGGVINGLNYHALGPYLHPEYRKLKANAVAAIAGSKVPVQVDTDSWDVPIFPPGVRERLEGQGIPLVTREQALASRTLRDLYRSQAKYTGKTTGRLMDEVLDFDGVNPFGRAAPFACRAPYRHLYINDFSFNLSPCCYLTGVPGSEPAMFVDGGSFMDAWNSEAFVTLRRRLRDGPLFNMCTKCPGTY